MDNQHRKISGYRELNQQEIDLMNEIKAVGPQLKILYDKVQDVIKQRSIAEGGAPLDGEPGRWAAIGRTNYQQGLMALTRAVASPTFE